jgi:hypothetical protein
MSVSVLTELEACPRRWALTAADFLDLWAHHGYPPRLQLPGLAGTVVHLAVEEATKAFVRAGCDSPRSPQIVSVMRDLGGYTALLGRCIQTVLAAHEGNPRAVHLLEAAARTLNNQVPDMRAHLQALLGRVRLDPAATSTRGGQQTGAVRVRRPLGLGIYPELEVRSSRIGWRGKIDVLSISDSGCEIIDFKTGKPQERHASQVRIYALLWSRDAELNPTARPADRLTLSYRSGEVRVDAPAALVLEALERELVDRTRAARAAAGARPPEARPSVDTCRYCAVRQLCQEYWTPETQRAIAAPLMKEPSFADIELAITGRHGPTSWDCVVVASSLAKVGRRVVLRTAPPGLSLKPNDRVRVIDAHMSIPVDEIEPGIATLGALSEVFIVEERELVTPSVLGQLGK